ncbi:MAG: protein-L-isoaspartate(D-aspartate) O-methyltransferase [Planctomycetes bacterium]|nr:protein-L-isoaspartate(D-aspartate) O-methyltransferase [Planctomycetota bacterium]
MSIPAQHSSIGCAALVLLTAIVSAGSAPAAVRQAPVSQQQSTTSIDGQAGASRPVSTRDTWNRPRTEEAAAKRREMVSRQIEARGVSDPKVLDAMRNVPRHWFVSSRSRNLAYSDRPLPIGDGQTISQPYIVALMTESLHLTAESKVLEIGTGSGYQAAVLSDITPHVFTIEIVEPLARRAIATFQKHGYDSIETRVGDGYAGWVEHAPYDGIIVTCAPDHIPPKLIEQLRTGGRICIPVGGEGVVQELVVVTKREDGRLERKSLIPVRFVPMTGEARTPKTGDSGD